MEEEEDPVELLIDGARYDDAEDVERALAAGVSVNSQDDQGRTGNNKFDCNIVYGNEGFYTYYVPTLTLHA